MTKVIKIHFLGGGGSDLIKVLDQKQSKQQPPYSLSKYEVSQPLNVALMKAQHEEWIEL